MKYVFVLTVLFLFLAGTASCEAKTVPLRKLQNECKMPQVAMSSSQQKHPADFTQDNQLDHYTFKLTDQRPVSAGTASCHFYWQAPHRGSVTAKRSYSSFHLPHIRRLLFPKHYFW